MSRDTTLGAAVALWMVFQVAFLMMNNRRADADTSARDKVILQEFQQTNGVRPASATEAELMEVALRKRENEARAEEREKARKAAEETRFEENARRRAEQVSAELNRSETFAREQARRDDEQAARQVERQKQAREDAERMRIEREQARWQKILRR